MSLSSQPGVLGALTRFWSRTYAADYVALAVVATGLLLVSLTTYFSRAYNR
jgi:diacylglycerol diphosphate phosphatase/phosphatidate phosphatase